MARPDFVIVGAQKAGTSSLFRYLVDLDEVAAPTRKEVHFFDLHFAEGVEWYEGHFPDAGSLITGEASPYYLFHPLAAARMSQIVPEVKVIVLLRDPKARAVSHYWHEVRLGHEDLSLEAALDAEAARLDGEEARLLADPTYRSFAHQHHSYTARGRYAEQLRRFLDRYPRQQVHVAAFEDLVGSSDVTLARVRQFLGLPEVSASPFPALNVGSYDDVSEAAASRLDDCFAGWSGEVAAVLAGSDQRSLDDDDDVAGAD